MILSLLLILIKKIFLVLLVECVFISIRLKKYILCIYVVISCFNYVKLLKYKIIKVKDKKNTWDFWKQNVLFFCTSYREGYKVQ